MEENSRNKQKTDILTPTIAPKDPLNPTQTVVEDQEK